MRGNPLTAAALAAAAIVCVGTPAHAQLELKWGAEGYYRTRTVAVTNLAAEPRYEIPHPTLGLPIVMPDIRNTTYITQRLRLTPSLSYQASSRVPAVAKLILQIDALDDVIYGDNNSLSSAPLFAVNGTNQHYLGGAQSDSVQISRAWMEFMVPVGLMRVGRMPSHWGAGVLANGGGSFNWDLTTPPGEPRRRNVDTYFDDDFGDNHFGSTNDRILFATRPITVAKTLMNPAGDTSSNLLVAYAFDKLSEASLLLSESDRIYRPFGQQGFISRGQKGDDANEHVVVLLYNNPDWDQVRYSDELKIGTYQVFRTQREGFTSPSLGAPYADVNECVSAGIPMGDDRCVTEDRGSFVWIADLWYRVRYGALYSEAELIKIMGKTTGGVPFPRANAYKKADITSGIFRAGYLTDPIEAVLELGYDSGDEDLLDQMPEADGTPSKLRMKQRPMHPDYNVGLLLFEEIERERSARVFGPNFISSVNPEGARGFMTNGGVLNAKYIYQKVRWRPFAGEGDLTGIKATLSQFEFVGAVLLAWVDKWSQQANVWVCPGTLTGQSCVDDATGKKLSKYLGTEIDLAVKTRFANDHMDFSLEAGYLKFGDPLKVTTSLPSRFIGDGPGSAFTIQARIAYLF